MTTAPAPCAPRSAPTTGAEIPGRHLRRLADAVVPHAAAEAYKPTLCAVQWEIRGGALWLAATDTYTMAAARWPLPDGTAGTAGPVLVSANDTAALARFAGTGQAPVTIGIAAGMVTVTRADGKTRSARWPLPAPTADDIPDWRSVLGGLVDGTAAPSSGRFTFNSEHLSRFKMQSAQACAVSGGWPAELRFRLRRHLRTRATLFLVTCEDWFAGAIRPMLTDGTFWGTADEELTRHWPGWLAAGAAQQPGPGAAKAGG